MTAVKAASHRVSKHSSNTVGHVARRVQQVLTTIVGLAVLGAVAIACVALVRGTWILTPILSGSMRPGLAVGGLAISERVPVDRLVVRDVIVFRDPNDPAKQIVHRIVRLRTSKSGQILINTKGDANPVRDPRHHASGGATRTWSVGPSRSSGISASPIRTIAGSCCSA